MGTMIILDTNVVSELTRLRPNPEVVRWFDSQVRDDLFTTVVTVSELCHGTGLVQAPEVRDRISRDNDSVLERFFPGRILNLDESAAREYAEILVHNQVVGVSVYRHDCMIAAIARVNGAPVATRNVRDFRRCGVPVINPWEAAAT